MQIGRFAAAGSRFQPNKKTAVESGMTHMTPPHGRDFAMIAALQAWKPAEALF